MRAREPGVEPLAPPGENQRVRAGAAALKPVGDAGRPLKVMKVQCLRRRHRTHPASGCIAQWWQCDNQSTIMCMRT